MSSSGLRHKYRPVFDIPHDMLFEELCSVLFSSLPRSDQRRKAAQYLRGLLAVRGRKSIRNIASVVGGDAAEQSLHHFITSSTWEWNPVRRALAQHLALIAPPQAWVLHPMVIPKVGDHSVGVDRRYVPALGQVLNAQHAVGVWAASDRLSLPINWRLHLPWSWLDDDHRRQQALIPDGVEEETLGDCAAEAVVGLPARWNLPSRPVLFDARSQDALRTVRRLRSDRVPLLARINGSFLLTLAGDAGSEPLPAFQLMLGVRELRRPVLLSGAGGPGWPGWPDAPGGPGTADGTGRESGPAGWLRLVSSVQVRFPGAAHRGWPPEREMQLFGVGVPGGPWPSELWLTDIPGLLPPAMLRLASHLHRVEREAARSSDRVGLRDFAGRSFSGWHRHVTLASAAQAVTALAGAPDGPQSVGTS
jgi:hypothetical protein